MLLVAACCSSAPGAALADIQGVVLAVETGDILTIEARGYIFELQLAKVDAPQREQPFGAEAQQSLHQLCHGKAVSVDELVLAHEPRILGRARCSGVDVSAEQVRRGLAWVVEGDAERGSTLYELEREARTVPRGLWTEAQPVPPWKWSIRR